MLIKIKNEKINKNFFEHLLNSNQLKQRMEISAPGSTRKTLTIGAFSELEIWLPPLPEQKEIESILSKTNDQISQQQSHLSNLKTMRKSILNSKLTPKMEEMIVL